MIPDYQTMMRPVLECAANGEAKISDVVQAVAELERVLPRVRIRGTVQPMRSFSRVASGIMVAALCGCAAQTRLDPDQFFSVASGQVPPKDVPLFSDCVLDGFEKAHSMFTNISSRQQRRSDGFRIESFAGARILLVSADVFDNGKVELLEANQAGLINTKGEKEAFEKCLARYGEQRR